MDDFKYYEIIMTDYSYEPNCVAWVVKCKRKPTKEEMEKFFANEMKTAECDHVDIIEEIDLEYVFSICGNLKREEDILIYETE